jgi:hypothetical protein
MATYCHVMRPTKLLSEQEVVEEYGLNLLTLRDWRHERRVLPFIKLGHAVRYRRSDIEEYLDGHTVAVES